MYEKKICKIRFNGPNSKQYNYFTLLEDLHENEVVIVEAENRIVPAYFVKYTDDVQDVNLATKWLIDRFDSKPYEKTRDETIGKYELYNKLQEEIDKIPKDEYYKLLATKNENIKVLLDAINAEE